MNIQFSIIIPVYNRPNEVLELLDSLTMQTFKKDLEIIIVEDGSSQKSDKIVEQFLKKLNIKYFYKENSGAGESRNFGMKQATGNYFIIFDSDCIIPPQYLTAVENQLLTKYTDAFGGADAAHVSFTKVQKAINYSMTSFFTTGGIRGNKNAVNKFQPRSFNFGLSKKAFDVTKGFRKMKIGEDIDLTFRLWNHNFETQFIEKAFVYHKRRATFKQFFKQTFSFGKARPFLNATYPKTAKITYWFPSIFLMGWLVTIISLWFEVTIFGWLYFMYFSIIFIDASIKNKSIQVGFLSIISTIVQFVGYGSGFLSGIFLNKKTD